MTERPTTINSQDVTINIYIVQGYTILAQFVAVDVKIPQTMETVQVSNYCGLGMERNDTRREDPHVKWW